MSPQIPLRAPQAPPRAPRGRGWTAGLSLLVLLILGLLYFGEKSPSGMERPFTVPKGSSVHDVARRLEAEGFVTSARTFLLWTRLQGGKSAIRPGIYSLSPKEGIRSILMKLQKGPPLMRVTFPEGWTAKQMNGLLEARGITAPGEFLSLVDREKREGYLFPDTYFFQQGLPARTVVDRLVARFNEMAPRDLAERARALRMTPKDLVTLASLVEKEARVAEERPLIAGVYLNRLRKRMRLEADPTVQYALGAWKERLNYKDLDVKSPYNTYRHAGLPPGPICNPGAGSLQAAAHPASTDALFFVADLQTGRHRFSRTYQEHLAVQKAMRRR
jgi:UPF0755 protein